jgi:hypothetical protein
LSAAPEVSGAFWEGKVDSSDNSSATRRLEMKRNLLVSAWLVVEFALLAGHAWAQCPEDPNDNGMCDTLYIEIWPGDEMPCVFPHHARFPIRVTSDIPDPGLDSLSGIVIPLSFTSTNPLANAQIEPARNTTDLYPMPDLDNSIFRHLPSMSDAQERNFMMDYAEQMIDLEWDTRILDLGTGDHFWLSIVPTGTADQRFPGGSRVLTATMTLTIEDTTSICIDSSFWPPTGRLAFSRMDAVTYFPRHFLPVYHAFAFYGLPPFLNCPSDQQHHTEGRYTILGFLAQDLDGTINGVSSNFVGEGVENVRLVNVSGLPWPDVTGDVEYDVTDHCQSGGTITITAWDDQGQAGQCWFEVSLLNDLPRLTLPDAWRALTGHTMLLEVNGVDPDGGIVGDIELEAVWYEPDSLQAPTNPPSYEPGNPGHLTWAFAQADTGVWMCAFSLTDSCGAEEMDYLAIEAGMLYCGDCTDDGTIDLADVVYLRSYLYKQGAPPEPPCKGDANCDGVADIGDLVALINYLYKHGTAPCFGCCP